MKLSNKVIFAIVSALAMTMLTGCYENCKIAKPFNTRDLSNWSLVGDPAKSKWTVGTPEMIKENNKMLAAKPGTGAMVNLAAEHGDSVDIYSNEKYGDSHIELELMVPKGSNSGIYVMGEYEIQVLDSFGVTEMKASDMGAIYGAAVPKLNASKAPGTWQKYVIDWQAPKFDAEGKKTANAKFIKIELNGRILHENLEMPAPTPGGLTRKEAPTGPIMFQGNHGPVAYKNITVCPLNCDKKANCPKKACPKKAKPACDKAKAACPKKAAACEKAKADCEKAKPACEIKTPCPEKPKASCEIKPPCDKAEASDPATEK